ncbi:MAG: hypothetical protein C0190_01435 [Thermodesulfobacterium geofontis]|uniref:Heavy-metal chelation domain-containing protein n=1 Tax=Thermodesulfobacterium geofontis TaxID=1295609 RepID=A0A2N7PPY4_9BACT|nr:MAG: hypothetical protein C0190_01435 [Thermodesulfobacterium geofontis]
MVYTDIYKNLVETSLSSARAKKIKRVCVGIHYTMVEIERGGTGLAYTLLPEIKTCCELGNEISFWKGPADVVIKGYLSSHPLEVSIGLATINAIFNHRRDFLKNAISGDVFSEIKLESKDEILMIGYFEPLFKKLEGKVEKIWVIDKAREELDFRISDISSKIKLAIITSSTLVNKTIHSILENLEGIPEVLLMGPTTPLNPEVFKFTPITWLCGSIVKDPELLFRLVCEGKGATSFFKSGVLEKINLRVRG